MKERTISCLSFYSTLFEALDVLGYPVIKMKEHGYGLFRVNPIDELLTW
jgi:hypothetical protein